MAGLMMTQKGLPITSQKDLQESWEPMLDHVKTISDSLQIATGVLTTLAIKPDRMKAALDPFMLATDEKSVEMRSDEGGTSRARVLEQVEVLKTMLA